MIAPTEDVTAYASTAIAHIEPATAYAVHATSYTEDADIHAEDEIAYVLLVNTVQRLQYPTQLL